MKLSKAAFQFNSGLKYKMKLLRVLLLCTLTIFIGFDIFSQSIVDTTYLEFSRKYQDYEEFRKFYPGNSRIQYSNGFLEFYDKEKDKNRRLKVEGLKEDVNIISRIPSNKGFVAFKEVETASRWLYFISNDGHIIKEVEINMYPAISFSEKGNFVVLYSA